MKPITIVLLLLPIFSSGQNTFTAVIKNETTKVPVHGATVQVNHAPLSATSDNTGIIRFEHIGNGKLSIEVSCIGFKETEKIFIVPLTTDTIIIYMEPSEKELEEVTVSTTRSNRSIRNTPSRVEVIADEEIHEEATMRPGDIKMLLSESTGIQTQQTSATTGNVSIRIQGLDGRYTQILKDGFPVYSGAASGLGLLQTPPLDLNQVEIIKGASSTLYGGGAIAGLINLVTKIPKDKRELSFHFNVTSAGGIDISGFYGQKFKRAGITLFIARNSNKAYDPAGISFSAIPKFDRYTVNPKLFLYLNDKTDFTLGVNTSFENRLGGDMKLIAGRGDSVHSYFERNKTERVSTQLTYVRRLTGTASFVVKNSAGYFNRVIESRGYKFEGSQYSSFTEATYVSKKKNNDWVAGINLVTEQFREKPLLSMVLRNYDQTTFGVFVQNTWKACKWLTIETGIRTDNVKSYGFSFLPKLSLLFSILPGLTSRIGGGLGYKPPTIFTEETEKLLYKNVLPIDAAINKLEKSYGANGDINLRTSLDQFTFSINQYFFYTYLNNPLLLQPVSRGFYQLQNIPGHVASSGAETNIKLGLDELALYLGYTYTHAKIYNNNTVTDNPLIPKHRFNTALVYEAEGKWKFGSEVYYFSKQQLSDGSEGRGYWLTGLVAERLWKKFSLFINFENFGDTRQTKYESIYTGTVTYPVFKDIYAPLEGFVVNGGVKIKL